MRAAHETTEECRCSCVSWTDIAFMDGWFPRSFWLRATDRAPRECGASVASKRERTGECSTRNLSPLSRVIGRSGKKKKNGRSWWRPVLGAE